MSKSVFRSLFAISLLVFSSDLFSGDMRDIFTYYSKGEAGTYTAGGMKHWQGASFTARNRLTEPNLISVELPSLKAGCSGIDFHAGGFSLVTRDELVQMARGIAQGAPGYFFNLAIGSICSSCLQAINEFMAKLHKFNDLTKNSCNKFWDMATDKFQSDTAKQAGNNQAKGGLLDSKIGFLTTWGDNLDKFYNDIQPGQSTGGLSNPTAAAVHNENIVIRKLSESYSSSSTIPVPGVTVNNFDLIMSLFGTVVIETIPNNTKGPDVTPLPPSITPEELVFSKEGAINFYECIDTLAAPDPDCLAPHTTAVTDYKGLKNTFIAILNDGPDSIIQKIASRRNLDSDQEDFVTAYRLPYLNIAVESRNFRSGDLVEFFALELSRKVVAELYSELLKTLRTSVVFSTDVSDKVDQEERLRELIDLAQKNIDAMNDKVTKESKKTAEVYKIYSSIEFLNQVGR